MKKGEQVKISYLVSKPARRMAWTETRTGQRRLDQAEIFYHRSDRLIKAFAAQETICTFPEKHESAGFIYEITVPPGTVIEIYGNECRFELTTECAVRYIGRKFARYGKNWKPGQHPTLIDGTI